jgi:putative addiction module killer protein
VTLFGRKVIRAYVTEDGKKPFVVWLAGLRDIKGKAIVWSRVRRLEEGNPGHCRSVGKGVHELKIDFGPGYRVYFGVDGPRLVILLFGGDKGSQDKDIAKAHLYWADYGRRK